MGGLFAPPGGHYGRHRGRGRAPPAPLAQPRVVVRCVERVQNWKLWTQYSLKREHIQDEVGLDAAQLNEHYLWHGRWVASLH